MQISDKKKAIFTSTLELVKERGFHGTPMSLVAKNAGVAAGTIYHYFQSKDELICELYNYYKSELISLIEKHLNDENLNFKEQFSAICHSIFSYYIESPNVLIFFEQYINSPYQNDKSHINTDGILYGYFKSASDKGYIKQVKPEIIIVLVLGNIATLAKLKTYADDLLSMQDFEQAIEIIWDGITAEGSF